MDEDTQNQDICRVCRSEGAHDRPLFHPCICTGSIKFIHQDCLVQWLRYSRKEYCELCKHRISFAPIYSPDMPKRLPIVDIFSGLARSMGTAIRYWLHYTLVAVAWLGIVPVSACRIYRFLFLGQVWSLFTLPVELFASGNFLNDIFHGCFVVTCTLSGFISLVWLREQILHGGGPDWLDHDLHNEENGGADGVRGADEFLENGDVAGPIGDLDGNVLNEGDGVGMGGGALQNNNNNNNNNNDDLNWNPMDWDRAPEELTWERLLGLDGSLLFVEHVFWVMSLNTMFIFVFAFCPYHIGHFVVLELNAKEFVEASHFEGLLTALCGYCVVGAALVMLHTLAALIRCNRSKRVLGLCYIVVKVALLSVVEIGVFPLVGGWWLDICSLSLFDATLKDRETSFNIAPATSMFIHWLVGMVYVFYFASFIPLLREVLRPGVLWFLRNLNDPDFNPVQEMIHLPIVRHTRRFLASMVIFGSTVLLMLWLPIRIIHYIWPAFLPYHITISSETPMNDLSLELLLLQVILPALFEQGNTRVWLKMVIRQWCIGVSHVLGLRSYLLGDAPLDAEDGEEVIGMDEAAAAEAAAEEEAEIDLAEVDLEDDDGVEEDVAAHEGGLRAAHEALLQRDGRPVGFQPYVRPRLFWLRILGLVVLMCISLTATAVVALTAPVAVGRFVMKTAFGDTKIHELYSGTCGLYLCLLAIRTLTMVASWISLGWTQILIKFKHWGVVGSKMAVVFLIVVGVIPLLVGVLIEVVIVVPLRVPLHQTPILFFWQDWAHGVLYTKILCAFVMMGPNWWLRTHLDQIYIGGVRNLDLRLIVGRTAMPVVATLCTCLAFPYVCVYTFAPLIAPPSMMLLVERRIYPALLVLYAFVSLATMQVKQFTRLYEHIKNDKYLVGKRLVNYYHSSHSASRVVPQPPAPAPQAAPEQPQQQVPAAAQLAVAVAAIRHPPTAPALEEEAGAVEVVPVLIPREDNVNGNANSNTNFINNVNNNPLEEVALQPPPIVEPDALVDFAR